MKNFEHGMNNTSSEKPTAIEQDTIRIIIGLLGSALPFLLAGGLYIYGKQTHPLSSISHYYYTRISPAFTITLGILAVVLFAYRGKTTVDLWLSSIAGLCALFVAFFPTNMRLIEDESVPGYYITFVSDDNFRGIFHFVSAGLFLFSLALMSFFRFPKNNSSNEEPNSLDKFMYKLYGIIMVIALLTVGLGVSGLILDKKWFVTHSGVYWCEAIAIWSFGYSWLLKAGFFSKFSRNINPFGK